MTSSCHQPPEAVAEKGKATSRRRHPRRRLRKRDSVMSDTIRYQYEANYASLDDIQTATNDAQALGDEVNKVFDALSGVYEGQAAACCRSSTFRSRRRWTPFSSRSPKPAPVATSRRKTPRRSTPTLPAASEYEVASKLRPGLRDPDVGRAGRSFSASRQQPARGGPT